MAENDREAFERREAETALARARGHVAELRRLFESGASYVDAHPYFEQLEADLNTVRPQTTGAVVDWQGNELNADGTRVTGGAYSGTRVDPGSQASRPNDVYDLGYQGDSRPTQSGVAAVQGPPVLVDDGRRADVEDDEIDDSNETEEQRQARYRAADK